MTSKKSAAKKPARKPAPAKQPPAKQPPAKKATPKSKFVLPIEPKAITGKKPKGTEDPGYSFVGRK